MLLLIKLGYTTEKSDYEAVCKILDKESTKGTKKEREADAKSTGSLSTGPSQNPSRKQSESDIKLEAEKAEYERIAKERNNEIKQRIKKLLNIKENPNFRITQVNSTMVKALRDTIQDIWSSVISLKCPYCKIKPPSVKIDANTKVMLGTKDEEKQVSKVLHNKKGYKPDTDKETEKNSGDKDSEAKDNVTKQTYINPIQVEKTI